MKKILKNLLLVVVAFCFATNVDADTWKKSSVTWYKTSSFGDNTPFKPKEVGIGIYTMLNVDSNKSYNAICLDTVKDSPSNADIFTSQRLDVQSSAYARGLSAIIANSKGDDKENFSAKEYAVRLFTMTMGHGATGTVKGRNNYNKYMYNTAVKWNVENKDIANKATGYNCDNADSFFKSMGLKDLNVIKGATSYNSSEVLNQNSTIVVEAKRLYLLGLNAAANSTTNSNLSLKKSTKHPSEKADTKTQYVQYDYYEINLNTGDSVNNFAINCTNCDANKKVEIVSYFENDGSEKSISNLSTLSFSGAKTITLKVKGSVNRNIGYDCTDLKYTISYDAPNGISEIYLLQKGESLQRFIAYSKGSTNINNELAVKFCDNNKCEYYEPKDFEDMTEEEFEDYTEECCTDLDALCNDSTNPAQQQYCDLYSEYCGACDTEIVVPNACQLTKDGEEADVNLVEGTTGYVKSAIDDDGNENIKACLLMRKKDEAGHSYKAMENSYCQVYCKEDFAFSLPDLKSVNSGTYFQLDATISGTKTCYTSEIDTEKFMADISGLSTNSEAYKQKVSEYNACTQMEVDYDCFDPVIEYEYEEIYNDQLGENDEFVPAGDIVEKDKKTTYCNSDINDDYSCKDGSTKVVSNIDGVAYTTKYVKSTVTKTGIYKTPSIFYTQHPSGTITTDKNASNITLIDGLPVAISTGKGRHQFTLSLKNIGEYYNETSCKSGRIIGDENSVLDKQNKESGKTGIFKAEYMCYYDVNCPECDFECEGPLCEIEQCDGVDCTPTCLGNGCAYSEAGLSYAYRTVSLSSLNPNASLGRKLGYNWNAENSVKAAETIDEIEANAEAAYENEPEYSFTLTPSLITAIKEYNKQELSNGGYTNETLTCSDDKYGNKNVNCESDFISKLVNGDIGNRNNKVTVPKSEDKFTSWLDSDYCNGTCTITKGSGIGPSWK